MGIIKILYSRAFAFGAIATVTIISMISVMGIGPFILGDELIYSFNSRFVPRTETNYGNYLYFQVFQTTGFCGEASYQCNKALNSSLAALSATLFYWFFSSKFDSLVTLALSLLLVSGPFIPFLGMFMPEVFFVLLLSIAIVLTANLTGISEYASWAIAGVAFALAALAKPHAVLLIPAVGLYFILRFFSDSDRRRHLAGIAVYVSSFVIAKLLLGFVFAGTNGLNILGPAYENALRGFFDRSDEVVDTRATISGPQVNSSAPDFQEAVLTQAPLLFLAVLTVLGPAIWFLVTAFSKRLQVSEPDEKAIRLGQLVLLSLLVMTIVIIGFTGLVTTTGDDHTDRTLFRYVEVLVPLAIGASAYLSSKVSKHYWPSLLLILPQLFVLIDRPFLVVSSADSAYLRLIVGENVWVSLLWITVVPLALYAVRAKGNSNTWLRPSIALSAGIAIVVTGLWTTSRLQPKITYSSPVLTAAQVVSDFAGAENGEGVHFVGNVRTELQGGMLLADMHQATISLKLAGQPIGLDELPDGTNWVVSTQEVYYEGPTLFQVVGEKYKVSLIGDIPIHFFGKDMQNDFVSEVSGFSQDALNGRWITENEAKVVFSEGLNSLSEYSIALQFFCSVDCSENSFKLKVNEASLDLVGGPAGDVIEAEFAIESKDSLASMIFSLPDDLKGKLAIRSIELKPRS